MEDKVFLATGVTVFQGARVRKQVEVRINGVVHVKSVLPERAVVPINWVAVGDPAQILPPNEHERIWAVQKPLNFPMEAYGVERAPDGSVDMKEITRRLVDSAEEHRRDTAPRSAPASSYFLLWSYCPLHHQLGGKMCMSKTAVPQMGYFVVCNDTEANQFALWEADAK